MLVYNKESLKVAHNAEFRILLMFLRLTNVKCTFVTNSVAALYSGKECYKFRNGINSYVE